MAESYETLTEGIAQLRAQGYTEDFNLKENVIEGKMTAIQLAYNEFKVDKFFRFEGDTDPADEAILYAVSSINHPVKGLLVNAFGTYSDTIANEIMEKLKAH